MRIIPFRRNTIVAKPITLKGTVTKVEWMNPHARFYVDVKDDGGKVTNWEFELGSPNGLMRQGWTRNSLKIGDVVQVSGSRAKDGSNLVNASNVAFETAKRGSGRRILGRRSHHEVNSLRRNWFRSSRIDRCSDVLGL